MNDKYNDSEFNNGEYKKIAIMGGTFDPIHYGHLVTAELVRSEFNIDLVLFIPTGSPPHKEEYKVTYPEHRYLMTKYATTANPYFAVSRIEIERPGKTYTIDTLKELKYIYGKDTEFYFITGADAVNQIMSWKDADELLNMCKFVAVTRPGYSNEELRLKSDELNTQYGSSIYYFEIPALAISSSDIRQRVKDGKPIRYLLPNEVEAHIIKSKLYKDMQLINIDEIKNCLRNNLSERRYRHTLGVACQAGRLAEIYGCDMRKAYLAGLIHDMAKELPNDRKLELCEDFGIRPDEQCLRQPDLLHGRLSAELAKRQFGIEDESVLDAAAFHTTGYPDMPTLSKIVFVADIIDPSRDIRDESVRQRRAAIEETAYSNLDAAVIECLRVKLDYTAEGNREIHPLSKQALEWYEKNGG